MKVHIRIKNELLCMKSHTLVSFCIEKVNENFKILYQWEHCMTPDKVEKLQKMIIDMCNLYRPCYYLP